MAVQTVPMDDTGMLADLMSDTPAQEAPPIEATPPPEPEPPRDERPRDEQGRFAPKQPEVRAEEPQPEAAPPQEPKDDEGKVPSWRVREIQESRREAERRAEEASRQNYALQEQLRQFQRQMEQLQPKQEPVDFFQDPDAAIKQRLTPMQQEFERRQSQALLNSSKALAIAEYGKDAVREMETAIDAAYRSNHPEMETLRARMQNSDHPVAIAMEWHQQKSLLEQTGGDIKAYRQKVLDEAMKDPTFQAKVLEAARGQAQAAPSSRPNIQLPKSLNSVAGSGLTSEADDNDTSDAGLFRQAMRSR